MERYVATFHTHLAAMRTCAALKKDGLEAMDRDVEAVYRRDGEDYALLSRGEE